jgi:O-6-methylguanine DNA methyltransferase
MSGLEQALHDLTTQPPAGLAEQTTVAAGAADLATLTDSPIGDVWVSWSINGITGVSPRFASATIDDFVTHHRRVAYQASRLPRDLEDAVEIALKHGETLGLPIDWRGVGDFQRSVLSACATIPPGMVRPYGWIAEEIHNPGSVRAVGTALGKNPIPLLVPCHRVVKSDGSVGNYAFGPELKQQLLVREGAILA